MPTPKRLTVFTQEIDTSQGPFSRAISLPVPGLASTSFNLTFSELPCRCAPTMVCIPIVATLELSWEGYTDPKAKAIVIKRGSLSFERSGGTAKKDRVSVGIGQFPDREIGSVKVSSFVTPGRDKTVIAKLELDVEIEQETTSLSRTLDLIDGRTKMDVCLVFPREGNRRLFASSEVLAGASPYWRAQLSTEGFNENLLESLDLDGDDFEHDSDFGDRDDAGDDDAEPLSEQLALPVGLRAIPIYGTAYATYRALIAWLYTSELTFAPLSTSFPTRQARNTSLALARALDSSPHSLRPVSPKSVYALSHFLSIPTLSDLALDHYVSCLSLETVLDELGSSFGETYDQVRDRVVAWLLETGTDRWLKLSPTERARKWRDGIRARGGASEAELEILFKLSGIEERGFEIKT